MKRLLICLIFSSTISCAVEPENYDDTKRSLEAGKRLSNKTTKFSICDSIVTPIPGELTFPILKKYLTGGKVVNESQILNAMVSAMQYLKLMVEPGGCVGFAAVLSKILDPREKTTIVILSGGNLSLKIFNKLKLGN